MITPDAGVMDFEPLTELDSQLKSYDVPLQLYLTKADAAYFAMGVLRKARYRVSPSFNALRERYPDTFFGLPVNNEYDEHWIYGDDHGGNHENCWCQEWNFYFDGEEEHFGDIGPNDSVLSLRIGGEVSEMGRLAYGNSYVLVFAFQYDSEYDNQMDSPFENIELWYDGSWNEYNELMEYLTETYAGGDSYRRGPRTKPNWTVFEPLEDFEAEGTT